MMQIDLTDHRPYGSYLYKQAANRDTIHTWGSCIITFQLHRLLSYGSYLYKQAAIKRYDPYLIQLPNYLPVIPLAVLWIVSL